MHVILWEFQVAPGREPEFERIYGASGAWAALFRRAPGYVGTELLRDAVRPGRYVTVDRWESAAAFAEFKAAFAGEYRALDRRCEALTGHEAALGEFAAPDAAP